MILIFSELGVMNDEDKICEPCHFRNLSVVATKYCEDCDERYCEQCMVGHTTQKLTRHHTLIDIKGEESIKQSACEPCSYQNQHLNAEYICLDCNERLCECCKCFHQSQKRNKSHCFHKVESKKMPSFSASCDNTKSEVIEEYICEDCVDAKQLGSKCEQEHNGLKFSRDHESSIEFSTKESR